MWVPCNFTGECTSIHTNVSQGIFFNIDDNVFYVNTGTYLLDKSTSTLVKISNISISKQGFWKIGNTLYYGNKYYFDTTNNTLELKEWTSAPASISSDIMWTANGNLYCQYGATTYKLIDEESGVWTEVCTSYV
jgi:hypothetical protein